jgi:hypothetical protein
MTLLFKRAARITIATLEIVVDPIVPGAHLDVAFNVERSLKPEPNTAELQIWNLNKDNRSALEELDQVPVQIDAGYEEQTALVYIGVMRTVFTTRDGPDLVTTIQSGDGEKEYQQSRINVSVSKGSSNTSVFKQVAKALGVATGNLESSDVASVLGSAPLLFPQGGVLSGQVSQIVTELTASLGLSWSIQNGALQFLPLAQPLAGSAVLLSPNTGLVGSPSVDNKGVLTAQTLLIPDLFPGRIVELESERLSGAFRVDKAKYSGDTAGDDWYIDLEASKL